MSIVSGRAIAAALAGRGHDVATWLIDLDGAWWRVPAEPEARCARPPAYDDPAALGAEGPFAGRGRPRAPGGARRRLRWSASPSTVRSARTARSRPCCEAAGLVYTGSGVAASALGMDKQRLQAARARARTAGRAWRALEAAAYRADAAGSLARLEAFAATLTDPRLMVKPAASARASGMTIVRRPDEPPELEAALAEAFRYDDLVLAEPYLAGARELEVGVVGNGLADLGRLRAGRDLPRPRVLRLPAKYDPGVSRTTATPELDERVRTTIREQATAAYLAVGASGFARRRLPARTAGGSTSRRSTPSPASPRSASSRSSGPAAAVTSPAWPSGSSSWPSSAAAGRPRTRLTRADLP